MVQVPETQWLPISTLESLAVVLTEKVYAPKSVVYYQGNEVEELFFVLKGTVKVIVMGHHCMLFRSVLRSECSVCSARRSKMHSVHVGMRCDEPWLMLPTIVEMASGHSMFLTCHEAYISTQQSCLLVLLNLHIPWTTPDPSFMR